MLNKYKEFKDWGKKGGTQKGINYQLTRKELIDKVSGQVDKEMLDLIQSKFTNEEIIRLLKAWGK